MHPAIKTVMEAEAEARRRLAEAEAEAARLVDAAHAEAKQLVERIGHETRLEAERLIRDAERQAENERAEQLERCRRQFDNDIQLDDAMRRDGAEAVIRAVIGVPACGSE